MYNRHYLRVGYTQTSSISNFIFPYIGMESLNVYSEKSRRIRCPQENYFYTSDLCLMCVL